MALLAKCTSMHTSRPRGKGTPAPVAALRPACIRAISSSGATTAAAAAALASLNCEGMLQQMQMQHQLHYLRCHPYVQTSQRVQCQHNTQGMYVTLQQPSSAPARPLDHMHACSLQLATGLDSSPQVHGPTPAQRGRAAATHTQPGALAAEVANSIPLAALLHYHTC